MERRLSDIARTIVATRERHATLTTKASSGDMSPDEGVEFASLDADLCAFEDMCRRTRTHNLMSTGLAWGAELRHPAAPSSPALVRSGDRVEYEGVAMTIASATSAVAAKAGRGVAIADWACGDVRLGDALGLEHPPRSAAAYKNADRPTVDEHRTVPTQASLF